MSRNVLKIIGVLLGGLMILSLTGCEPEQDTTPILPGEIAFLTLTFSPNPVYQGYEDKYRFTLRVDEMNGVGATISSVKVEYVNSEGGVIETDHYDASEVSSDLFGTSRIEAYGRLMSNIVVNDCFSCDRQNWLIRANDDKGNYVEYSGNIELIAR